MEVTKKQDNEKEESRPHSAKVIEYNEQPWLTDIIIYQKGLKKHAHLTLSGAQILYLRDAEGRVWTI